MRRLLHFLLLPIVTSAAAGAQNSCVPKALPDASAAVARIRHTLHEEAVGEDDPRIPPAIGDNILQLKAALATAAEAAFACAPDDATPESLEGTLANALHANAAGGDTPVELRNGKETGLYGSDLGVQVFTLYSSPKYIEVDFRYGLSCGDDNLLLVFVKGSSPGPWREVLHWGAPHYSDVGDAYGDFILMTPVAGFPSDRNWRFVVAHGSPACDAGKNVSHFTLDLLEPTPDSADPHVAWHLEHPYGRGEVPRLSTTEDTLTFQLSAPEGKGAKQNSSSSLATSYRFHVSKDNKVEPMVQAEHGAALSDR